MQYIPTTKPSPTLSDEQNGFEDYCPEPPEIYPVEQTEIESVPPLDPDEPIPF